MTAETRTGLPAGRLMLAGLMLLASAAPLGARTITLTAEDADRMAVLDPRSPRLSWAAYRVAADAVVSGPNLQLFNNMAVLIRFPLDRIPKDQRIVKAELVLPRAEHVDNPPRLELRRLQADWGPGVCHIYRMTVPQKVEWAQPGGRGPGDRAEKISATFQTKKGEELTADVTEDVELWYTGATANRGWIMTFESGYAVYFPSPYSPHADGGKHWQLRITFEPR